MSKAPEISGTATGISLLAADSVAAQSGALDQPILPLPDAPPTGDPWADVAMFALRCMFILGITLGPTALGKWLAHRNGKPRLVPPVSPESNSKKGP